jgi:hypothetical protein
MKEAELQYSTNNKETKDISVQKAKDVGINTSMKE